MKILKVMMMIKRFSHTFLKAAIWIFTLFSFCFVNAQPNYATKQTVEEIVVVQDLKKSNLYYYEPGNLVLNQTKNNVPNFHFLDLRYTGTKCNNDAGEKSFMSLVQFTVEMEKVDSKTLSAIKKVLKKKKSITLKPLPIAHIDTKVILPVENNTTNENRIVESGGSLESNDSNGFSTSKSFWTRRTFTVKLNKFESQLLRKQLTEKVLSLSLNYSYFSNVPIQNEEISGSKALIEDLKKDSTLVGKEIYENKLVKANTLSLSIDIEAFPETIKQVDINEEIPPSYAAIEVKCFDFTENLRPDLYMKLIEIEALSVRDREPIVISTKFTRKNSDLHTNYIRFPYAVLMNASMKYRIIEIDTKGDRTEFDWIEKSECTSVINGTSEREMQKTTNETIEVELDEVLFSETTSKVEFHVFYSFMNTIKTEKIVFENNDESLQNISFQYDTNTKLYYLIKKYKTNGEKIVEEEKELKDTYLFIGE